VEEKGAAEARELIGDAGPSDARIESGRIFAPAGRARYIG